MGSFRRFLHRLHESLGANRPRRHDPRRHLGRLRCELLEDRLAPAVTNLTSGDSFATIQAAIDADRTLDGHILALDSATYAESVMITKSLALQSATGNPADVIIDPLAGDAVTIMASGVTLQNLRVTGAVNGITASGVGDVSLVNVRVENNTDLGLNLTNVVGTLSLSGLSLLMNGGGNMVDGDGLTSLNVATGAGNDSVLLTNTQLRLAAAQQAVNYSGFARFSLATLGGDDTLTVMNPDGSLVAGFTGGISYDGGGRAPDGGGGGTGNDALVLMGGGGLTFSGTYSVGPGPGDGTLTATNGTITQSITFTGLEPVTDTVTMGTFTINATDDSNVITLDNGTANGDGLVRVTIDAFEPVQFANKTNVVVNAGLTDLDLADTIVVAYTETATGLMNVTFNGGGDADLFSVRSTPLGPTTVVNGGAGSDTFSLGSLARSLNGLLGAVSVNAVPGEMGRSDLLDLGDQATMTAQTYTLTATTFQRSGTALVTFAAVANVTLSAGTGADTVNVSGTTMGTATVVNLGAGADTVNVGSNPMMPGSSTLDGIQGVLSVNDDVMDMAPGDVLNVNDQGAMAANTYTLSDTTVQRTGVAAIAFLGLEAVTLNAGSGNDTINVVATMQGVVTTVNAGAGADVINVGAARPGGGDPPGSGDPSAPSLDSIQGALIVNGQDSPATPVNTVTVTADGVTVTNTLPVGDVLNLNDQAGGLGNTYTLTATTAQRTGTGLITYGTVETLNLNASAGADTINVTGTAASVNTTVNTTAGGDAVNVMATGTNGTLVVNGDADANTVLIASTGMASVTVVNALGGNDVLTLTASGMGSGVRLDGGAGLDVLTVAATGSAGATDVRGGADNDTINVGAPSAPRPGGGFDGGTLDGILGAVAVSGDGNDAAPGGLGFLGVNVRPPAGDVLSVNDAGDADANTYSVDAATVQRGMTRIAYQTVETIALNAGTGADTITVTTTAAATTTLVNAGDGADVVTVAGTGMGSALGIDGGAGADTITVRATAAGSLTTVSGGAGNDTVAVGSMTNSLAGILGTVGVDGGADMDSLTVNDQGNPVGVTYAIAAASVQRSGAAMVLYGMVESLTVNAGSGGNAVNVLSTTAATTVNAGAGNDAVRVGSQDTAVANAFASVTAPMATSSQLVTINLATGAATAVGMIGGGAAVRDIAAAPVGGVIFAVDVNNRLLRFNAATPGTIDAMTPITGLQMGETVLGIDFRPRTGQLYALGSTSRLYLLDPVTGAATQVGSGPFSTLLDGTDFGFDFNPVPDRIRVVSNTGQNLRLNPDTGDVAVVDDPLAFAEGDPNEAATPNSVASAYTDNFAGARQTTLYNIDAALGILVRQGDLGGAPVSPNSGQLFTVGMLGVPTTGLVSFDIGTSSVDGVLAALTINGQGGTNSLVLDDSSDTTSDQVTVSATQVGAGTGDRFFGDGGSLTYGGFATLMLNAGQAGDVINVTGTAMGTAYTVNASAGNDTINVGSVAPAGDGTRPPDGGTMPPPPDVSMSTLDTILGALTVNGGANLADPMVSVTVGDRTNALPVGDVLNVNDQGRTAAANYTLAADSVRRMGATPINYAAVESVNLNAGSGNDVITVAGTGAMTNASVSAGAGADATTILNTGAGSNLIINGGDGNDSVLLQNTGMNSVTGVNGDGGNDLIESRGLGAGGAAQLNGVDGNDTIRIRAGAAGTTTAANGGGGNDAIDFGTLGSTLGGLLGTILVDGGEGTADTSGLFDSGTTTPSTYELTDFTFRRFNRLNNQLEVGLIRYAGLENLLLITGTGTDLVAVLGTATGARTVVVGTGGGDSVQIGNTGVASTLAVQLDDLPNAVEVFTTGFASITDVVTLGGNDFVRVRNSGEGCFLRTSGGTGQDTFVVLGAGGTNSINSFNGDTDNDFAFAGPPTLEAIRGAVFYSGGDGFDTLQIDDSGDTAPNQGSLFINGLVGLGLGGTLNFDTLEGVGLVLGSGDDFLAVFGVPNATVDIFLGFGNDAFQVVNPVGGFSRVFGGFGNDEFLFNQNAFLPGFVFGEAGVDRLNYAFTATGVFVDLATGAATGVNAAIGFEDATGGSGSDTLIGDNGPNTLRGGPSPDNLFGRLGFDIFLIESLDDVDNIDLGGAGGNGGSIVSLS